MTLTLAQKVSKLKKAGYMEGSAGMWRKPSKRVRNWTYVIDIGVEPAVVYVEDQYGRVQSDMDPVNWDMFKFKA